MTEFTESFNIPQWERARFQFFANLHETAGWDVEEAIESLTELSKAETLTPTSTTFIVPAPTPLQEWSHASAISLQQAQSSHLILLAKTESLTSKESWYEHYLTREPLRFQQPTETRWIQNLRHPSYQLRQAIPIVVEREGEVVTAHYDDLNLTAVGDHLGAAISALCGEIVAYYEKTQKSADRESNPPTQAQAFLKQMIVETQPKAWEEIKLLYAEKLKAFPYVDKGYIDISASDYADIILILSDESADRIVQLAEIDLELNLSFRPLNFSVEYQSSEEYLDLDGFQRFY